MGTHWQSLSHVRSHGELHVWFGHRCSRKRGLGSPEMMRPCEEIEGEGKDKRKVERRNK